jgi:hypothetical protein
MSAVDTRYAAWEDKLVLFGRKDQDVVYLRQLEYDPKIEVTGGFIRVRGEKDEDNGPRSDIVEFVKGRLEKEAGFRLKSTEGMKHGDRVWVSITIKR